MTSSIRYIDQIALEKNRDVLFLHFEDFVEEEWAGETQRDQVIQWLELHGIGFEPCMGFKLTDALDVYTGDLYLDVAYDPTCLKYQELSAHLEDSHGNMKLEGVYFFVLEIDTIYQSLAENLNQSVYCFDTDKLS